MPTFILWTRSCPGFNRKVSSVYSARAWPMKSIVSLSRPNLLDALTGTHTKEHTKRDEGKRGSQTDMGGEPMSFSPMIGSWIPAKEEKKEKPFISRQTQPLCTCFRVRFWAGHEGQRVLGLT